MAKLSPRTPWAIETELPLGSGDWRVLEAHPTKEEADRHLGLYDERVKMPKNLRVRFAFVSKPQPANT